MKKSAHLASACALTMMAALSAISPAVAADDGVSAADLETGKATVFANEPTRMWECWEEGAESPPRLYQLVDRKWKLLDVSTMERDATLCGQATPIKATYEFTLLPAGTFIEAKKYYEARVLTKCKGCESYRWKIRFKNRDLLF